jgi:hypothetical protein
VYRAAIGNRLEGLPAKFNYSHRNVTRQYSFFIRLPYKCPKHEDLIFANLGLPDIRMQSSATPTFFELIIYIQCYAYGLHMGCIEHGGIAQVAGDGA